MGSALSTQEAQDIADLLIQGVLSALPIPLMKHVNTLTNTRKGSMNYLSSITSSKSPLNTNFFMMSLVKLLVTGNAFYNAEDHSGMICSIQQVSYRLITAFR
jgi:hypothetical protein